MQTIAITITETDNSQGSGLNISVDCEACPGVTESETQMTNQLIEWIKYMMEKVALENKTNLDVKHIRSPGL